MSRVFCSYIDKNAPVKYEFKSIKITRPYYEPNMTNSRLAK